MERRLLLLASVFAVGWLGVHAVHMLGVVRVSDWVSWLVVPSGFATCIPALLRHPNVNLFSPKIRLKDLLSGAPRSIIGLLLVLLAYLLALLIYPVANDEEPDMAGLLTVGGAYFQVAVIILLLSGRAQQDVSQF